MDEDGKVVPDAQITLSARLLGADASEDEKKAPAAKSMMVKIRRWLPWRQRCG